MILLLDSCQVFYIRHVLYVYIYIRTYIWHTNHHGVIVDFQTKRTALISIQATAGFPPTWPPQLLSLYASVDGKQSGTMKLQNEIMIHMSYMCSKNEKSNDKTNKGTCDLSTSNACVCFVDSIKPGISAQFLTTFTKIHESPCARSSSSHAICRP